MPTATAFATTFGAIVTGIGAVMLLVALLLTAAGRRFRGRGVNVRGTIVGHESSAVPDGVVFRPTVTFTTLDGREVTASSSVGRNPRPGRIGQSVPVAYDPRDPQHVRVKIGGTGSCLLPAFAVVGALITAAGVSILLLAR